MSVSITNAIDGPFYGDGVAVAFPYTLAANSSSEIAVYTVADGVTALVSDSLYSVTHSVTSGTVTFGTAPANSGTTKIFIASNPDFTQLVEFTQGSNYNAAAVNNVADRAAVRDIALKNLLDRAIVAPVGDSFGSVPSNAARRNKVLGFDESGEMSVSLLSDAEAAAAASAAAAAASEASAEISAASTLAASGAVASIDIAAGLAATTEGDTFWVDNGDGTGSTYRHDAGPAATLLTKFIIDPTAPGASSLLGTADGETVEGRLARYQVSTIAALEALTPAVGDAANLRLTGKEGSFVAALASSHTAAIAADTAKAIYIPSTVDAAMVWVRQYTGNFQAEWAGLRSGNTAAANKTAWTAIMALAAALTPSAVLATPVATVELGYGTINVGDGGDASAVAVATAGLRFVGKGMKNTVLKFTASASNKKMFNVTADNVEFESLGFDGTANAVKAGTVGAANAIMINAADVNSMRVHACEFIGGHYSIDMTNAAVDYTANKNHQITNCFFSNMASTGVHADALSNAIIKGNNAQNCGNDGFKFSKGTVNCIVEGNFSAYNTRDGFDLYDGFIGGSFSNNIAAYNTLVGFELKGTYGGSYGEADYVDRDTVVSGNVAYGNTLAGFAVLSTRNMAFTGNVSVLNGTSGFELTSVQVCSFTGNVAAKNTQHGYDIIVGCSRNSFSACHAYDNSYVDGTVQNGTYHGFNIRAGNSSKFIGCDSIIGTTTGRKGGQGYGFFFATGAAGSVVDDCYALSNITGSYGGSTGWAAANFVANNYAAGLWKGMAFTDDALSIMKIIGTLNATVAYQVNGTKVLGAQGAAVADATDAATAITQLNALLARCRAHGLIAT